MTGALRHDHWQPYFKHDHVPHSLGNAHLERELTGLVEEFKLCWPVAMIDLLYSIKMGVELEGGRLGEDARQLAREDCREILRQAEDECPEEPRPPGVRGRPKKSKGRNLLERLSNDEDRVLRFMTDALVPFTKNRAENDIRMLKVQQKISGRFRSKTGADDFRLLRSCLLTCDRNGLGPHEALTILFSGQLPTFLSASLLDMGEEQKAA